MKTPRRGIDLTIGLVGLGMMGREHARRLIERGYEVRGTDADGALRRRFEVEFDAESYESPGRLIETDVDAVVVSVPPKYREQIARDALEAGLHVYLENPMADTVDGAERIVEAAQDAPGICVVNLGFLYARKLRVLKSYVDAGLFGDLMHVEATHMFRRFIPSKGSWFTSRTLSGGGVLKDRGSYVLGVLLHLNDWASVDRVMAKTHGEFGSREDYSYLDMWGDETSERIFDVEDSAYAMLELENGCTAFVSLAWAANIEDERRHEYEIHGTEAGAELDLNQITEDTLSINQVRSAGEDHFFDASVRTDEESINLFMKQLERFLDGIREGSQPKLGTVEQGLQIARLVDRIYEEST